MSPKAKTRSESAQGRVCEACGNRRYVSFGVHDFPCAECGATVAEIPDLPDVPDVPDEVPADGAEKQDS